jgi:hypothetical protein
MKRPNLIYTIVGIATCSLLLCFLAPATSYGGPQPPSKAQKRISIDGEILNAETIRKIQSKDSIRVITFACKETSVAAIRELKDLPNLKRLNFPNLPANKQQAIELGSLTQLNFLSLGVASIDSLPILFKMDHLDQIAFDAKQCTQLSMINILELKSFRAASIKNSPLTTQQLAQMSTWPRMDAESRIEYFHDLKERLNKKRTTARQQAIALAKEDSPIPANSDTGKAIERAEVKLAWLAQRYESYRDPPRSFRPSFFGGGFSPMRDEANRSGNFAARAHIQRDYDELSKKIDAAKLQYHLEQVKQQIELTKQEREFGTAFGLL